MNQDRTADPSFNDAAAATTGLGLGAALTCIVLVALDLRPGLVSMGPLLPAIRHDFGLSHTAAALLTSIPDVLLGLLALPAPGLARRFGRDRIIIAALVLLGISRRSLDRRIWLALSAALAAAGLFVMVVAPNSAPFIYLPVTAFGMGGAFTLGMTLPLDNTRSAGEAGVWTAFVLMVAYLIAATGPLFVGALRDFTGSFFTSWVLLLAVAIGMLALTPFLRLHVRASGQGHDD